MSAGVWIRPVVEEDLDLLLAQALDVEGVARDEMLQALDRLRRADEAAGAAAHHVDLAGLLVDLAHGVAAADRADARGTDRALRPCGRLSEHDAEDLRDDVAGALHDHRVADAHVLARDLVLVVQRGVGDDDAADRHRLELGDGVSAPVRPTWMSMPRRIVVACSAGNLCAIAQRGERETKPSRSCQSSRLTL